MGARPSGDAKLDANSVECAEVAMASDPPLECAVAGKEWEWEYEDDESDEDEEDNDEEDEEKNCLAKSSACAAVMAGCAGL